METEKEIVSHQPALIVHSLLFILGFSLVFILAWGGIATAIGQALTAYKKVISWVGGIVVIIFGLATLRIIHLPWLNYGLRAQWQVGKGGPLVSSFLLGVFFAFGWTPCIGTTLGAILTLGMSQDSSLQAMVLSSGYALGMGLPFFALGLWAGESAKIIGKFRKMIRPIEIVSGIVLLIIGLLMVTGQMSRLSSWTLKNGFYLDLPLGESITPTYFLAMLAGLLSFFSPCVLPLVPGYLAYLGGQIIKGINE